MLSILITRITEVSQWITPTPPPPQPPNPTPGLELVIPIDGSGMAYNIVAGYQTANQTGFLDLALTAVVVFIVLSGLVIVYRSIREL